MSAAQPSTEEEEEEEEESTSLLGAIDGITRNEPGVWAVGREKQPEAAAAQA